MGTAATYRRQGGNHHGIGSETDVGIHSRDSRRRALYALSAITAGTTEDAGIGPFRNDWMRVVRHLSYGHSLTVRAAATGTLRGPAPLPITVHPCRFGRLNAVELPP